MRVDNQCVVNKELLTAASQLLDITAFILLDTAETCNGRALELILTVFRDTAWHELAYA